MKRFPRGSEWRKWDLHVHPPGTKLSDGYEKKSGALDWDRFCEIIHESDVEAIGIADYFSLDGFFAFKEEYERRYPDSGKVFFPNLELRLNEAVNKASEYVHMHLILRPDIKREKADEFLRRLNTESRDEASRLMSCSEMASERDYEKATVSRDSIKKAITETFGEKTDRSDNVIVVAAANNDGIRPASGNRRRMELSDELDKFSDSFFGSPDNTDYFLDSDRLETETHRERPKPVFTGCDAHSFGQLDAWLGKEATGDNAKHVTWIKADLTFEGLQQTLIEPSERVRIQATKPDKKEPYKVISKIVFSNSDLFPSKVEFNPGLNSVIGSRSSGKSALLAYIAHAIDPEYTVRQQLGVIPSAGEAAVGPGAGVTWDDVADMEYSVVWAAPTAATGRVIYVPQNALFSISADPDRITAMIRPTIFRLSPVFRARFIEADVAVDRSNGSIRNALYQWFSLNEEVASLKEEIRALGDREAVTQRESELKGQIEFLQKELALSEDDVERYQQVIRDIGLRELRLKEIAREKTTLEPYVEAGEEGRYDTTDKVKASVELVPSPAILPDALRDQVERLAEESKTQLLQLVRSAICNYRSALAVEEQEAHEAIKTIRSENRELIKKGEANAQVDSLIKDRKTQAETLAEIDAKAKLVCERTGKMDELLDAIEVEVNKRDALLAGLAAAFNRENLCFENMHFKVEADFDEEDVDRVSRGFNKTESSEFIITKQDMVQRAVDVMKAISEPREFVKYMGAGKQKVNQGESEISLTKDVLTLNRDIRFVATLEHDRIGGFETSTMTPGKQALFALTLLLAESDEPWPLLIDQPEDDLDSRSVCETIVDDLMKRKRERQIIMVSRDANLVIGADSEEIVVANRHGADRPNKDDRMFEYLTGSLEHSEPKRSSAKTVLASSGIREHACEILDGGVEAFEKRKRKYRI